MDPSPGDASLSPLPPELARERGAVLHRALRTLPLALLEPLLRGLRRHADALVPGHLATGDGGCAVGMMLQELALDPSWQEAARCRAERRWRSCGARPRSTTAGPSWPPSYPRLHHVEIVFDVTCKRLRDEGVMDHDDVPRAVGLWMAAETQSEINMRHLEAGAEDTDAPPLPPRSVPLDAELFEATVRAADDSCGRGSSRAQATTAVESLIGARRLEPDPLFMPSAWEHELELQRQRLAATSR